MLGKLVTVTVDRPMGSAHPKFPETIYPINYGYIKEIIAGDGDEQDAYILGVEAPLTEFTGEVIAIIHRNNDVEEKWVVAPIGQKFSLEEIKDQVAFTEQYFDSIIIV